MDFQILLHFFTATALAGLIGTEREIVQRGYEKDHLERKLYGGVRTHILLAFFGAIIGILAKDFSSPGIIIGGIAVLSLFILAYYCFGLFKENHVGITSELSGILTFMIGVLCLTGYTTLAVIVGIGIAIILSSKIYLARIFENIERKELYNTLKFAVILFVILPLLPNQALDPWNILNLYDIWKVVVLISGISYVGYILSKTIGASKGIMLSGVLGGLASSTAVTSSMSEQSRKNTHLVIPFVIATIIASSMMFFRVLFWVASFNNSLVSLMILPVLAMGLTSALLVGILWYWGMRKKAEDHTHEATLESPFQVLPALKFALFFIVVSILSEVAARYFGDTGTYAVSLISGLADVDSITVKLAQQASTGAITESVATKAIIIAMMTNTFVKIVLAKTFGGKKFGNAIALTFSIILLAGGASLFFI